MLFRLFVVVFFVSLMVGCSCGGGLAAASLLPDSTERSPSESDGLPWMESQAADRYLHCTVPKSSCLRARVPGQSKRWEIGSSEKPQRGQLGSITVLVSFVTLC